MFLKIALKCIQGKFYIPIHVFLLKQNISNSRMDIIITILKYKMLKMYKNKRIYLINSMRTYTVDILFPIDYQLG